MSCKVRAAQKRGSRGRKPRERDVFQLRLSLGLLAPGECDANNTSTPIPVQGKWQRQGKSREASIKLPHVSDGDYLLRSVVSSKLGKSEVDMKLALYAPARIHVLTDRPLYEPGNLVQFRALALRARGLTPIDNRPGTWIVRDPSGEILLEEKAPAQEWGVVAGTFPLATNAQQGTWQVAWRSGNDEESAAFQVEPFVLPRFRVDSSSDKAFYQAGDVPELRGAVVYSSGAPEPMPLWKFSGRRRGHGHHRAAGSKGMTYPHRRARVRTDALHCHCQRCQRICAGARLSRLASRPPILRAIESRQQAPSC